jgi:hypothetical protein
MHIIKDFFYLIIIFLGVWFAFYLTHRHDTLEQKTARYDCKLAEFVPNVPPEVREECRRRTIEQFNQQQQGI